MTSSSGPADSSSSFFLLMRVFPANICLFASDDVMLIAAIASASWASRIIVLGDTLYASERRKAVDFCIVPFWQLGSCCENRATCVEIIQMSASSRFAKSFSTVLNGISCFTYISYLLCPSTRIPPQVTRASRQPFCKRFSSSDLYISLLIPLFQNLLVTVYSLKGLESQGEK